MRGNKSAIDVKSTVVKEQPKSDKSYQNKKTYRASTKHYIKERTSSNQYYRDYRNAKEDDSTKSSSTQTIASPSYKANTESNFTTQRSPIYYCGFSEATSELDLLKLSPLHSTIKSGETVQFKLTRLDSFDNQIEIKDGISWSATAGEINSTGLFSIDSLDDILVTITAKVGTLETSTTVNVESIYELIETTQLKSLKVAPDCISLKPEEEQVFKALGFDRYNNSIDCGEIIWSATGGAIDQNGKLIVSNNAKGIYQVTATSKDTAKYGTAAKTTLLTLGVSTRVLSWAIANEEFFYDVLAPLLNLTNDDDSLSETDAIVQGWILEIGRRRIAKLLKKASNLSFKEAFSNISDSIDYIVLPELRKIEFVNPPSNIKPGDRIQLNVIGLDQAGDKLDVQDEIIWTTTSGKINWQGVLVAENSADSVEIAAQAKGKNIEAKIKINIEESYEEYDVDTKNTKTLNNSFSLKGLIASSVTEMITKTNSYVEQKALVDSVNPVKIKNISHSNNKIVQKNTSTYRDKQEQEITSASKYSTYKSQLDSSSSSSSKTNHSDSNCNSASNILPLGISNSKPIKHYINRVALEKYAASHVCNTDRKLLSCLNSTEEREFKKGKASYNKSSHSN